MLRVILPLLQCPEALLQVLPLEGLPDAFNELGEIGAFLGGDLAGSNGGEQLRLHDHQVWNLLWLLDIEVTGRPLRGDAMRSR